MQEKEGNLKKIQPLSHKMWWKEEKTSTESGEMGGGGLQTAQFRRINVCMTAVPGTEERNCVVKSNNGI